MGYKTRRTGDNGEEIACGYLEKIGCKIIDRNFTTPFGEIDIIALSPDKTLIIVEVKASETGKISGNIIRQSYPQCMNSHGQYPPELHLHKRKISKLCTLAQWYSNTYFPDRLCRIDGICIDLFLNGHTIRHYKNIGYY